MARDIPKVFRCEAMQAVVGGSPCPNFTIQRFDKPHTTAVASLPGFLKHVDELATTMDEGYAGQVRAAADALRRALEADDTDAATCAALKLGLVVQWAVVADEQCLVGERKYSVYSENGCKALVSLTEHRVLEFMRHKTDATLDDVAVHLWDGPYYPERQRSKMDSMVYRLNLAANDRFNLNFRIKSGMLKKEPFSHASREK